MDDERQESSPLDEGSEMIAHSAQAAYAVSAAVKAGGTASGVAAGTAMAGPLGTLVGTLAGSKTVWKVFGAIFLFLFLWMFIIANMISTIWGLQPRIPMQMRHSPTSLQISGTERSKFCKTQIIRMRFCRS